MRDLAARQSFSYGTRRLRAGDYFTARTTADARALVALGKARPQGDKKIEALPKQRRSLSGDKDALKKLRADYQEVHKKKPFAGWDAVELQRRIDEALQ